MVIGSFEQLPFYYQFFLISKKLNLRYSLGKSNVAYFYLNRPQAHNALNMELIREMRQALREMEGLRALVLTGEGKTFCAGGDLKWMEEMTKQEVPGG